MHPSPTAPTDEPRRRRRLDSGYQPRNFHRVTSADIARPAHLVLAARTRHFRPTVLLRLRPLLLPFLACFLASRCPTPRRSTKNPTGLRTESRRPLSSGAHTRFLQLTPN
ncbi:hypothetical protein GALMADRAFT_238750 [Galerina marginata CBS 339.88]|uniref:Uncharacterized protein n=1 Tax=Galerina marginata (strain CBS 339.88) TaxID=685588 RepID=A0A067TIH7_GALM3|nr:hypothetical protein GALMADRAFT_238750 [Galerina marginata CBS 339.88]